MATGGSIESIAIAGREYAVPADAEYQLKIGGFENEVQANGNGTARIIKMRVPWSLTGGSVVVDDDNGDLEFLQERANSSRYEVITITYASGAIYQGSGIPTGEVQKSSQSTTVPIEFMGQGTATKQ